MIDICSTTPNYYTWSEVRRDASTISCSRQTVEPPLAPERDTSVQPPEIKSHLAPANGGCPFAGEAEHL